MSVIDILEKARILLPMKLKSKVKDGHLKSGEHKIIGEWKQLYQALRYSSVSIDIELKDKDKKKVLYEALEILKQNAIKIELIERDCVFEREDIDKLNQISPDIELNLRYIIKSHYTGENVKTNYPVGDYNKILDKIHFLTEVTRANFKEKDKQVLFVLKEIAQYISYDEEAEKKQKEEFRERSGLKHALNERKTVCCGFSMLLERCLRDLNIPCNIVNGWYGEGNLERNSLFLNHSWNQIQLNNNWYNVDLTFFSGDKNIARNILVDDETFRDHILTSAYKSYPAPNRYPVEKIDEFYREIESVKNVFELYDQGYRKTILQHHITTEQTETASQVTKDDKHYEHSLMH